MTFEKANELARYKILDEFEIVMHECLCNSCVNNGCCYAMEEAHECYPSDSVEECKYYEEG